MVVVLALLFDDVQNGTVSVSVAILQCEQLSFKMPQHYAFDSVSRRRDRLSAQQGRDQAQCVAADAAQRSPLCEKRQTFLLRS